MTKIELEMTCEEGPLRIGNCSVMRSTDTSKKTCNDRTLPTFEGSKRKRSRILGQLEDELERQLEEKAKRNELSGDNVQTLLKAVLTQEDVFKYVESTMEKSDELPEYQLTLTRAKAKELIDRIPKIAPLLCLPTLQKKSDIDVLIRGELPDDSSDEEYQPLDETVDDDDESMLIVGDASETSTCGTINSGRPDVESVENIGQRTRSKFSLSQTPLETIEQAFIPPDITEDMYDTECDNQDWLNFLKELIQPLDTSVSQEAHDDDDPEYNIQPHELKAVDTEELRADRAVEISKKEINDLIDELLEYTTDTHEDGVPSDEETSLKAEGNLFNIPSGAHDHHHEQPAEHQITTQQVPQPSVRPLFNTPNSSAGTSRELVPKCIKTFDVVSKEQYLLIKQQLAQHVQLLLQTCLLSCGSPFVSEEIQEAAKSSLIELKTRQDSANIIDSIFLLPSLDKSIELLSAYERIVNPNIEAMKAWNKEKASHNKYVRTAWAGCPPIHPTLMRLCLLSKAFQYPLLLPRNGFRASTKAKIVGLFSPTHDFLITSGLHDCEVNLEKKLNDAGLMECSQLIHNALVPDRTPKCIFNRIKRKCSRGPATNPINKYIKLKIHPGVEHYVVPVDHSKLIPLYLRDIKLIGVSWHKALYEERDKHGSLLAQQKQVLSEQRCRSKVLNEVILP